MSGGITTNADRIAFMEKLVKEMKRKENLAKNPNLLSELIKQNNHPKKGGPDIKRWIPGG